MKASLWINKTKAGKTNLRGNFQPKDENSFASSKKSDDDLPF
jgi:hypothetical protein